MPGATLLNGKEPIQASYGTTVDTPQPLGVGINVVYPHGGRCALPLFFLSHGAAKSRGVKFGWYVAAEMGQRFEIVVTNVHAEGAMSVKGKLVPPPQVATPKLQVDGSPVLLPNVVKELDGLLQYNFTGFFLRCTLDSSRLEHKFVIRPFVFQSAVGENGLGTNGNQHLGCIVLRTCLAAITGRGVLSIGSRILRPG